MIGLKRGTVTLYPHQTEWDEDARRTIEQLKELFGELAVDIQHVGSTSIPNIAAKPILDFAVGIYDFKELEQLVPKLEKEGIIYRPSDDREGHRLFVMGNFDRDTRTHHIHVVEYQGKEWQQQIFFRDYLKEHLQAAKEYETLKVKLQKQYPLDRNAYTEGKADFIQQILHKMRINEKENQIK